MILRLAETLQIPLRERNALLLAAGYAPLYRHTNLDTPEARGGAPCRGASHGAT